MIVNTERRRLCSTLVGGLMIAWSLIICSIDPGFAQMPDKLSIYVSEKGNDNNNGTSNAPFKSIEAARNHIRKLKSSGRLPTQGLTVIIKGGNYLLPEGIVFSDKDSGSPKGSIVYRAAKGEKVNLSSGRKIDLSLVKPLGESALKRVHPKVEVSRLMEIDLTSLQLKNASSFAPGNCFSDNWYIIDFFINDKRQLLSQWPNPTENIKAANDAGWVTCNGTKDNKTFYYGAGGSPEDKELINELDLDGSDRSSRWASAVGQGRELWLKGFWRVPWEPFSIKVETISTKENSITLAEEPDGGMGSKYSAIVNKDPLWRRGLGKEKWKAINLLEEIDYPGEWALDIKDQKIYFYAPSAEKDLNILIADSDQPVIDLSGASHIKLIGLHVSGSRSNGIELNNSNNITIASCTLTNVAANGIVIKGGKNNLVQSNDIFETGGAGVVVSNAGDRRSLTPSGTILSNNHIYQIGKLAFREAIQLANSVAINVNHNLMHDMPKSAIRTDMVNNCVFEYNEVHNIALGESDNGAFYNYGGWSTYGNVFRYNFVHHINRSNGFYCDDGDSGDMFYNNIVYDAIDAIKFGGGHNNIAKNNLFIRCKDQGIDDRGISRNYSLGSQYEARLREMRPEQEPWKSYGQKIKADYGLKASLWSDIFKPEWHPEYPNGCVMADNVSVQCGPYLKPKHGDVTIADNLEISDVSQAGFYDLDKLDLRTSNAGILKKFPKLNTTLAATGLRKDQYRVTIPTKNEVGGLQNRGKAGNAWDEDQLIK